MRFRVLVWLLAFAAGSRLLAEQWLLPGATNATASNGLHYATDLKLYNQGAVSATVTLDLIAEAGDAPVDPVSQSIAPGQTVAVSNVLQSVWGLSERTAALRITADQPLVISAFTYTDANPGGLYAAALDAVPYERWSSAGATVHSAWVTQSSDFDSTAGVILAAPNTTVDLRLYDAAGRQIARRQISGGPALQRISLGLLSPGDLPVGRVEFYIISGRALAYTLTADNLTGDPIFVSALPDTAQPLDAALSGLVKAGSATPQTVRSDLRIANLSTQPAAVKITVLSSSAAGLAGQSATVNVPAAQIQEIADLLGQLFHAPEDATAALRIQSPQPAIALARTATVNADGSPGGFGALVRSVALADFLGPAAQATLAGLRQDHAAPGAASHIGLLAGPDGAGAQLTLSGPDGTALGSATIALGPFTAQETSLGDLFPASIPDDSRLDVQMTSGALTAFARTADLGSGDTRISPAALQQPYVCPAPAIVSFTASPAALAAAGQTTLYWSAANADTVAIAPGVASPALSGSAAVNITSTTSFSITAAGPCGTASRQLTVAVGAPSISSVSPASAMPGQLLTLKLANIPDRVPIQSAAVLFRSLKLSVRIESTTPAGEVTIRAPFVADSTDPAGHLTGAVTLALDLPGSRTTAPFTILPLRYAGDAAADLRSLTLAVTQYAKDQLNTAQQVPQFTPAVAKILPFIDQVGAVLNQAASDIESRGSTQIPVSLPPAAAVPPPVVTVTRKDLELFLALYAQISGAAPGALPALASLAQTRRVRAAASGPGQCLADKLPPYYQYCLDRAGSDPFRSFQQAFLQLIQQSASGQCTIAGYGATASVVSAYLAKTLETLQIMCQLEPVQIAGFTASPLPDPIPTGARNQGAQILANLEPLIGPPYNAFDIASAPYGEALLALGQLPSSCQGQLQPAVHDLFGRMLNELTSVVQSVLDVLKPVDPAASVPVYKCDLNDIQPLAPDSLARLPGLDDDAAQRFGLQGLKSGVVPLNVDTRDKHFLREAQWSRKDIFRYRYLEQDPSAADIRRTTVTVAGGKKVIVTYSQQNLGPDMPQNALRFTQTVVPGGSYQVPLAAGEPFSGQPAYEVHSVEQVNDNTWLAQVSLGGNAQGGVDLSFTNPPNRGGTQRIVVNASGSGKDCGMYFTAMVRGADGMAIGPSYDVLHGDLTQYTIDAPGGVNGRVFLLLDGVSGGACQAFATIRLLDQ